MRLDTLHIFYAQDSGGGGSAYVPPPDDSGGNLTNDPGQAYDPGTYYTPPPPPVAPPPSVVGPTNWTGNYQAADTGFAHGDLPPGASGAWRWADWYIAQHPELSAGLQYGAQDPRYNVPYSWEYQAPQTANLLAQRNLAPPAAPTPPPAPIQHGDLAVDQSQNQQPIVAPPPAPSIPVTAAQTTSDLLQASQAPQMVSAPPLLRGNLATDPTQNQQASGVDYLPSQHGALPLDQTQNQIARPVPLPDITLGDVTKQAIQSGLQALAPVATGQVSPQQAILNTDASLLGAAGQAIPSQLNPLTALQNVIGQNANNIVGGPGTAPYPRQGQMDASGSSGANTDFLTNAPWMTPGTSVTDPTQVQTFSSGAPSTGSGGRTQGGSERQMDLGHYYSARDEVTQLIDQVNNGLIDPNTAKARITELEGQMTSLWGSINDQMNSNVDAQGNLTPDARNVQGGNLKDVLSSIGYDPLAKLQQIAQQQSSGGGGAGSYGAGSGSSTGTRSSTGTGTGTSPQDLQWQKDQVASDLVQKMLTTYLDYATKHYYGGLYGPGYIGPQGLGAPQKLPEPPAVQDYYSAHPELGADPFAQPAQFQGYTGNTYFNPQQGFTQSAPVGLTQSNNTPINAPVQDMSHRASPAVAVAGQAPPPVGVVNPPPVGSDQAFDFSGLNHVPYGSELTGASGYGATITPNGTPVPLSPWQKAHLDTTSVDRITSYQNDIAGANPADFLDQEKNNEPGNIPLPGRFAQNVTT